jgi:hypothetical protein
VSLTTGGLTLPRRGSLVAGGLTLADFVPGGGLTADGATATLSWASEPGTPTITGGALTADGATAVLTWQAYAGQATGGSLSTTGATAAMTWATTPGSIFMSNAGPPATIIVQADPSRKRASFYS